MNEGNAAAAQTPKSITRWLPNHSCMPAFFPASESIKALVQLAARQSSRLTPPTVEVGRYEPRHVFGLVTAPAI
jgi:hypothetical protein